MSRSNALFARAGFREAGASCRYCGDDVLEGDAITVCQECGTIYHRPCWDVHPACESYTCAPARRATDAATGPVLTITRDDVERAVPLPSRRPGTSFQPFELPPTPPPRTNRLAIWALVLAVLGVPFVGVPGLVAILLGSLALGSIRGGRQKGTGLALAGILLGVVDVVGWIVVLGSFFTGGPMPHVDLNDLQPDEAVLNDLSPPIRRAMRANVLIERPGRWGALDMAIGSGVILAIEDGEALIVTNRHVVDPDFPAPHAAGQRAREGAGRLVVRMVGGGSHSGRIVWEAPGEIDLALIRVACPTDAPQAALWAPHRTVRVGEPVFAIGNPHNLGWTHTQGSLSQVRTKVVDGHRLRILQTQAAINPGNSGGGLYDQHGYLLGIATWTADKRVSEGLSFAIAIDTLLDLQAPLPAAGKKK